MRRWWEALGKRLGWSLSPIDLPPHRRATKYAYWCPCGWYADDPSWEALAGKMRAHKTRCPKSVPLADIPPT